MSKIGLFFGSTTGKTESVAEQIQKEFGGKNVVTLHNIIDVEDSDFQTINISSLAARPGMLANYKATGMAILMKS